MTHDEFLLQLQPKEMQAGLFDFKIDGIVVYKLIRRSLIESGLRKLGVKVMNKKQTYKTIDLIKSTILSAWQLFKIRFSNRTASTIFISFPRIDKVGGRYMDKFVDPLVSFCFNNDDYIILDPGQNHIHAEPRLHHKQCIRTEWFIAKSLYYSKLFWKSFYKSHKDCLDSFCEAVFSVFGDCTLSKKDIIRSILFCLQQAYDYERFFLHLKTKRILGPSWYFIRLYIVAAHRLGIQSFELQHGIVYGLTKDNSGYQPEDSAPDYFLAYGEGNTANIADPEKIVNIGWAFGEYVSSIKEFVQYNEQDVLVISEPTVTDKMIDDTLFLAKNNPKSHFYLRPHPNERISELQKNKLESLPNAHWQDNHINIAIVMQGFTHVVGENSTVLYEALAAGKKVGKLNFGGLHPRYLKEEDKECFWEVCDQETFSLFLNEDISKKRTKSIYSPFNKKLFMEITGIKDNI